MLLGFVLIYYRFAGLVANVALGINLILLFGAMSRFHFVLTLPGFVGTYSSIFAASPIVLWRSRRKGGDRILPPAPAHDSMTLKQAGDARTLCIK